MAWLIRPTKPVPIPSGADVFEIDGRPHVRVCDGKKPAAYPLTRDGLKYLRPSKKWYGKYADGNGVTRTVPLSADKSAAKQLLAELVRKAERQRIGLFDPAEDHARRPLAAHLTDYAAFLESKGDTPDHVRQTTTRVTALLTGCGFAFPRDADPAKAAEWLNALRRDGRTVELPEGETAFAPARAAALLGVSPAAVRAGVKRHGLAATGNGKARTLPRATVETLALRAARGTGPQTVNHYLRAVRGFFRWLLKARRIGSNPRDTLTLLNAQSDVRRGRRELTAAELHRLFTAARTSSKRFRGLSGDDRFHLYLTAAATGFRATALANLTPADFALDSDGPTVTLAARWNKSRTPKVQPLPSDVADALRGFLAGKPVGTRVWGGMWASDKRGAEMMRNDLDGAGIAYTVEGPDGPEYADFHFLQHSYLTLGGRSGIDLRTLQELAGHSKPELTARYSHRRLYDLAGAVLKLPELVPPVTPVMPEAVAETLRRTGTDDVQLSARDVPTQCIRPLLFAQSRAVDQCATVADGPRNPLNGNGPVHFCTGPHQPALARATGLEPATTGSTVRYSNQLSYAP